MRAILYMVVAVISLYYPLRVLIKPKRKLISAQLLSAFSLLSASILFFFMACYSMPLFEGSQTVDAIVISFSPLPAFFYFLFIRELSSKDGVRAKDLLALLPVLAVWTFLILNLAGDRSQWSLYVTTVLNSVEVDGVDPQEMFGTRILLHYWLFRLILIVFYSSILVYGIKRVKSYHVELENYYSELSGLAGSMNTYASVFTYITLSVVLVFLTSTATESGPVTPLDFLVCATCCIMILFFGIYAYGLEHSAKTLAEELGEADSSFEKKNPTNVASAQGRTRVAQALREALENEIYLEPNIDLVSLADRVGTNRTYLSNVIRDEYGQNFSEFINSRRILHAIRMLEGEAATERYPMRYIAMKCGYSSLQTFYNNFSRYTGGKTPAGYMKD